LRLNNDWHLSKKAADSGIKHQFPGANLH